MKHLSKEETDQPPVEHEKAPGVEGGGRMKEQLRRVRTAIFSAWRFLRRLNPKDDLRLIFGHLKPKRIMLSVAGGGLFLYALSGVYLVNPGEQAVERLLGKVVRSGISEGLHYSLPWPLQRVDIVNTAEIQRESIGIAHDEHAGLHSSSGKIQVLTGDENIVDVEMIIQYRISDPVKYLFAVDFRSFQIINETVRFAVTKIVGNLKVDDILTVAKEDIQKRVMSETQALADQYQSGITIVTVNINKLYPPDEVADSFRDVASAREDKLREISQAEGYRNGLIPPAQGEAAKNLREAESYGADVMNRARGEADRFLSILSEYRRSLAGGSADVTRGRLYMETMERVMPKVKKYVVDQSTGRVNLKILDKLN